MKKNESPLINEKAWNVIDKIRGFDFRGPEELANLLKDKNVQFSATDLTALGLLMATRLGRSGGMFCHIPQWLTEVFSLVIEGVAPKTICDPWAGSGFLLGILCKSFKANKAIALTPNQGEAALGKMLVPDADWQCGAPLQSLDVANMELDVIASILPMNAKSDYPLIYPLPLGGEIELGDDLGNIILVAASRHLSSLGVGLFVVTPSFFSPRSVFHKFSEIGLGIEAALALPSGTFAPYTNIPSYLIIVRRNPSTQMFVAQLSADSNKNHQIIGNLRKKCKGVSLELGQLVSTETFKGVSEIRVAEAFALAEKRFGALSVKFEELATAINLGQQGDSFAFEPFENAIFIPLIGNSDVVESCEDFKLKPQNYAQAVIDPARSNARFVTRFLNSEFGKQQMDQSKTGLIPKLNKLRLRGMNIFVPDLSTQREMVAIEGKITAEQNTVKALQNELTELSRELWASPKTASNVDQQIGYLAGRLAGGIKLHTIESLEQWIESLPFPLASILRAWQAAPSQDFKTKYEHLLHFFEGTTQFIGIILLSAFSSNDAFFESHKHKLKEIMQSQNLSFQRATFGTWRVVVDYLVKQTRKLLSEDGKKTDNAKNDRSLCADIFADPSLSLPQALSRKDLATIISTTNKMRNDWGGHGGVVGQEDAKMRNEQLLGEVQKFREAVADTWAETQLIHSLHSRHRNGVYDNEISILMSSNSEFLKESRTMSICLDVERLYLAKKGSDRALKLIPLIQVGSSPPSAKNACYFFNRLERDGARFISYHFMDKPELIEQFPDAAETIKFLTKD